MAQEVGGSKQSKAEYIALQFPERFYVFDKNVLREKL